MPVAIFNFVFNDSLARKKKLKIATDYAFYFFDGKIIQNVVLWIVYDYICTMPNVL